MQCSEDTEVEVVSPSPSQPGGSSANSSTALYNPQVKNDLVPKLKQKFASLDDAHKFYNNYAKESGFSIRINSSKLGKEGQIIRKEYVCYKEGARSEKNTQLISEKTVRKRGLTREGCCAKMSVVRDKSGGEGYEVIQFFEGHNHPLTTPGKVHLLRSHRDVSAAKKALTQQLAAANVAMNQQMSVLDVQSGGLENIGFLERDLRNAERDRRKILEGHDANMLYEYFENEKQMNPSFMFSWEPSDDGRMIHCFWADATSRKSYEYFGDVVVFDTTYNTNRYGFIFAPIFWVNHHFQTTLLGCAFLSGEKSDAFNWFFKVWLNSMPGGPPKMIITDQDPAMAKAIATFLPNTLHRFCIWHIINKFSEKIGALSYKEHYDEFSKCIWKSESREEFKERWVEVVKKANLSNNEWLNDMYKICDRWIPAYVRHIFSAGMSSSQRAEISHSFYKKYVNPHNSMMDFVTRFGRALARVRHNELDLDHKDVNERPLFRTSKLMESKASELYTQSIFYKFQEELFQGGAYVVTRTFKDELRGLYNVKREKESGSKGREVLVEKSLNYVSCSCKMFECEGIPCRHMLAYFMKKQFVEVPSEYILRRWTKSAKTSRVMDDLGGRVKEICDTPLLGRRQRLLQLACNVIDEAVVDEDDSKLLEESLLSAQKKFTGKKRAREDEIGSTHEVPISLGSQHNWSEPFPVRYKGCGKRLKGGKEKSLKKGRRCNGCGLIGQSHDKRNCPKLLNRMGQLLIPKMETCGDEDDFFQNGVFAFIFK